MKRRLFHTAILIGISLFSGCGARQAHSVSYYFDPVNGDDHHNGKSSDQAFRTLARIRQLFLRPGDSILLKSGATFRETLYFSAKGDSARPIVIGKYGGRAYPYIKGDASQMQAIHIFNSEALVVRDLEVSNQGDTAVNGLNGVLVELSNYGTAKHIVLDNLYVHDVLGGLVKEKGGGNAILLRSFQDEKTDTVSSRFAGLVVQNCHIRNCQRNGIMMWGNWIRRLWNPSLDVVIRNNLLEGVPGDGIVPVACESPLVEYNIMRDCPRTLPASEACDGIWPWSCDNAVIQYNIVSDHKSQVDGYAFDADWNCRNSLFQYNLSYNNDGGFLLVCNPGGWEKGWNIGNSGTIVRYNISINDGIRNYSVPGRTRKFFSPVIHITGATTNTRIEKNLIVVLNKPEHRLDKTLMSLDDWNGFADSTYFQHNIVVADELSRAVEETQSVRNFYAGNRYIDPLTFMKYLNHSNKEAWYDPNDPGWQKLMNFVSGKVIPDLGKEKYVGEILRLLGK